MGWRRRSTERWRERPARRRPFVRRRGRTPAQGRRLLTAPWRREGGRRSRAARRRRGRTTRTTARHEPFAGRVSKRGRGAPGRSGRGDIALLRQRCPSYRKGERKRVSEPFLLHNDRRIESEGKVSPAPDARHTGRPCEATASRQQTPATTSLQDANTRRRWLTRSTRRDGDRFATSTLSYRRRASWTCPTIILKLAGWPLRRRRRRDLTRPPIA